jgi:DNA-binding NarL/FixJ family response regulator
VTIRVLLVDDHAMMRDGIKALLASDPDIQVIAEADNGRDAVRYAEELNPDLVVMDISMPDLNGVESTRLIHDKWPQIRIVVLSMQSTSEYVFRALQAGASGYLVKTSAGDEMIAAIRSVHAGNRYLARALASLELRAMIETGHQSPLDRLSVRERHVLQLVVEGHSSVEIAKLIHLSPKTVETYRSRLMKKLNVFDVTELVKFALEHGVTHLK